MRFLRLAIAATLTALLAVGAASCGSDDGTAGLSEAAARGKRTSNGNGCASCHGANGQGGVGPKFTGLAGTIVELDDGSEVLADDAYLTRAIVVPDFEIRPGYAVRMPENNLTAAQTADIVAWINELADE